MTDNQNNLQPQKTDTDLNELNLQSILNSEDQELHKKIDAAKKLLIDNKHIVIPLTDNLADNVIDQLDYDGEIKPNEKLKEQQLEIRLLDGNKLLAILRNVTDESVLEPLIYIIENTNSELNLILYINNTYPREIFEEICRIRDEIVKRDGNKLVVINNKGLAGCTSHALFLKMELSKLFGLKVRSNLYVTSSLAEAYKKLGIEEES
jgi:hypothetical protein